MPVVQADFNTQPNDQLLMKLGRCLVRAGHVEHMARLLIKDLTSKAFLQGMAHSQGDLSLKPLAGFIKELVARNENGRIKSLVVPERNKLKKIAESMTHLAELRNKIIHSRWTVTVSAKEKVTAAEFKDFHRKSCWIMNEIENFRKPKYVSAPREAFTEWPA